MLKEGVGFKRVIICCGRVDLRKGIPGLTAYVKLNYGLSTMGKGPLFLFCGNRTDRIKGIVFEGDCDLVYNEKLGFFIKSNGEEPVCPVCGSQIKYRDQVSRIMKGYNR